MKKLSVFTVLILLALSLPTFAGTKRKSSKKAKATQSRKHQKKMQPKKASTQTDGSNQ